MYPPPREMHKHSRGGHQPQGNGSSPQGSAKSFYVPEYCKERDNEPFEYRVQNAAVIEDRAKVHLPTCTQSRDL
jgi:hypothetical protein